MSQAEQNEIQAVEQTLVDWYTAITEHAMDAVAAALAPGFLLVENTELLDRVALLERLTLGINYGTQTAVLSEFHTVVQGDVAWTTLRNHEVWTPKEGDPVRLEFIETVVLRKSAGRWLMERYQATPVVQPAPPAAA
jgi:ketosteroid isomerase-like protein